MKKILIASASAVALMGLAACSDTDEMTTQGVDPAPMDAPAVDAAPPADEPAAPLEDPAAPAAPLN
jgi:opacity protein-like surface antigen